MWLNAGHLTPLSLSFSILIKALIVSQTKAFLCLSLLWYLYLMVWTSCLGQPNLPVFCFLVSCTLSGWLEHGWVGMEAMSPPVVFCDPFHTWWWLPVWDPGQLHPHWVWVLLLPVGDLGKWLFLWILLYLICKKGLMISNICFRGLWWTLILANGCWAFNLCWA